MQQKSNEILLLVLSKRKSKANQETITIFSRNQIELFIHSPEIENSYRMHQKQKAFFALVIFFILELILTICSSQIDRTNKHGILLEMVQALTDLDLIISKSYISSDGGWLMDGQYICVCVCLPE